MKKIKIALVDDHQLIREGIGALLTGIETIEVIASVSSGEDALNVAKENCPDLFLMDIVMKGISGIETTRWLKEQNLSVKIILISSEINKDYITEGIKMGIDGYLPKDTNKTTLVQAIETVMRGEKFFSPEIMSLVFKDFFLKETEGKGLPTKKTTQLSRREEEVLKHIAGGQPLKKIGEALFISVKTVETHKIHIQDKLGLTNTAQLVKYAIDNKLI